MPLKESPFDQYFIEYKKIKKALEHIQMKECALIAAGKTSKDPIIRELEHKFDATVDRQTKITRKLMNTPSLTMHHICVKMRVFMEDNGLDCEESDSKYEGSIRPRGYSATDFSRLLEELERISGVAT